jgi:integrase
LEDMQRLRPTEGGDSFVFPGGKAGKPLSNMAFLMLLRRMGRGDLTAHGFRATFKTWASERTAAQNEIVEASLAHVIGGKVEQAYRCGDLFEKRRRLMQQWATFCTTPVGQPQNEIVALRVEVPT